MGYSSSSIPGTARLLDDFSGVMASNQGSLAGMRVRVRWYRHTNEKTRFVREWVTVGGMDEPLVMQFSGRNLPQARASVLDLRRSVE